MYFYRILDLPLYRIPNLYPLLTDSTIDPLISWFYSSVSFLTPPKKRRLKYLRTEFETPHLRDRVLFSTISDSVFCIHCRPEGGFDLLMLR